MDGRMEGRCGTDEHSDEDERCRRADARTGLQLIAATTEKAEGTGEPRSPRPFPDCSPQGFTRDKHGTHRVLRHCFSVLEAMQKTTNNTNSHLPSKTPLFLFVESQRGWKHFSKKMNRISVWMSSVYMTVLRIACGGEGTANLNSPSAEKKGKGKWTAR